MRIPLIAGAGVAVFVACGCQTSVPIRLGSLPTPKTQVGRSVTMLSKATDARSKPSEKIGRHTISLLMIPGLTVHTDKGNLEDVIATHCNTGLKKAGYDVTMVDGLNDATGPVLVSQLNFVRNYCFTWVYPLGLTFGKMRISLVLFGPRQEVLWKKDLDAKIGVGASLIYMAGFGSATKMEMTGCVKELMEVCSSPEFIAALEGSRAVSP